KERFGHTVGLASDGEQLPDERNRVTLDSDVKDNYGLPVPRITNVCFQNESAMVEAISRSHREILEAGGARDIRVDKMVPGGSSHYLGTCRMGKNRERSVVNSECRTHDVPNLYIGDGSVFVTGAAVNPALTISALAARTAEGILAAFRRGEFS
ncbi:MAG TPA: GMC family oxidoreductase, partial [Terriglobia bacterium]|nr:GMC family oxidoreductase [Terriglobia bacterium]